MKTLIYIGTAVHLFDGFSDYKLLTVYSLVCTILQACKSYLYNLEVGDCILLRYRELCGGGCGGFSAASYDEGSPHRARREVLQLHHALLR